MSALTTLREVDVTGKKVNQVTVVYAPCFHREAMQEVPNPRLSWPKPRTCPGCNRKRRVCEVHVEYEKSKAEEARYSLL